jgi:membrane-associated phospholipid phosphatase
MHQHRRKRYLITLLLSLHFAFPVKAQQTNPQTVALPQSKDQDSQASDPDNQPGFRRFFHDEYRIWTSPFRAGNYDSHTVKKYGVPFLLISGALIASDRKTADLLPNSQDQAIWSGRVSQIGASYTLAGMAGATYLIGKATGDKHAGETGFLGLEAIAHSHLVVLGIKGVTQRQRPLADKQRGGFWKGGDSLPSGHAANSFALATVFAYEYRDHIAVPITAYSIASLVAVSRMGARRHWASDIFVGSSLGLLVGRYVYKHHHDPNLPGSPVHRTSRLIPTFTFGDREIGLYWSF